MICLVCARMFKGPLIFLPHHPSYYGWTYDNPTHSHHQNLDSLRKSVKQGCFICTDIWQLFSEDIAEENGKDSLHSRSIRTYIQQAFSKNSEQKNDRDTPFTTFGFECGERSVQRYYELNQLKSFDEFLNTLGLPACLQIRIKARISYTSFQLTSRGQGYTKRDEPPPDISAFTLSPKFTQNFSRSTSTNEIKIFGLAKQWIDNCIKHHPQCCGTSHDTNPTRLLYIGSPAKAYIQLVCNLINKVEYTTLSHCWGLVQPLKLTKYNRSTLEAGILIKDLPKTFREAVKFATALGYTYIWIDSLCIIQDSQDDWEKESSTMHQIYGGAVFNIAATASSDCDGGLFRPRYKPELGQTIVSLSFDGFPTLEAVLSSHALDRSLDHEDTENLVGPLLNRGWVVQERIMAKRVIHFGPAGIWFECSVAQACERFPIAVHSNLMDLKQQSILNLAKGHNLIYKWMKIVENFSSCSLTFDKDKLVALSGLAKIIRDSSGYRYLAGIFDCREGFAHQLLWSADLFDPAKRPKDFRAPTWSWASVNASIYFPSEIGTQGFEILDASVIPLSSDDTSELLGGILRLKGVLRALDVDLSKTCSFYGEPVEAVSFHGEPVDYHLFLRDADEHIQTDRAHAFLMAASECNRFLVLQPTTHQRGEFRRVGMFRGLRDKTYPSVHPSQMPDWLEYEDFDEETMMYTISIV